MSDEVSEKPAQIEPGIAKKYAKRPGFHPMETYNKYAKEVAKENVDQIETKVPDLAKRATYLSLLIMNKQLTNPNQNLRQEAAAFFITRFMDTKLFKTAGAPTSTPKLKYEFKRAREEKKDKE